MHLNLYGPFRLVSGSVLSSVWFAYRNFKAFEVVKIVKSRPISPYYRTCRRWTWAYGAWPDALNVYCLYIPPHALPDDVSRQA